MKLTDLEMIVWLHAFVRGHHDPSQAAYAVFKLRGETFPSGESDAELAEQQRVVDDMHAAVRAENEHQRRELES